MSILLFFAQQALRIPIIWGSVSGANLGNCHIIYVFNFELIVIYWIRGGQISIRLHYLDYERDVYLFHKLFD